MDIRQEVALSKSGLLDKSDSDQNPLRNEDSGVVKATPALPRFNPFDNLADKLAKKNVLNPTPISKFNPFDKLPTKTVVTANAPVDVQDKYKAPSVVKEKKKEKVVKDKEKLDADKVISDLVSDFASEKLKEKLKGKVISDVVTEKSKEKVISDVVMEKSKQKKKLFARHLKINGHPRHSAIRKVKPRIPKLKWRTKKNFRDCGIFTMLHMESYTGEAATKWDCGLVVESTEQSDMLRRLRFKYATKILLHDINEHVGKMFELAKEFDKIPPSERMSIISEAVRNRDARECMQVEQ